MSRSQPLQTDRQTDGQTRDISRHSAMLCLFSYSTRQFNVAVKGDAKSKLSLRTADLCPKASKYKPSYLLICLYNLQYYDNLHQILALEIAAKPLRLLLRAYRNLPTPYPTVLSPTPYHVSFSHSTCITLHTNRQTTDGRQNVTIA